MNSRKQNGPLKWLYRKLSSLRVSVYILGVLSFFYGIGTVFPQGAELKDYEEAGGKFLGAVKFFNLLDIFNTPWFLIPAFILFLNLLVCTYDRFFVIRTRKRNIPETFTPTIEIPLALGPADARERVEGILKKNLGFKELRSARTWTVFEKGLSYRWLTWLYHAAIVAGFIGFLISGLFVREGMITLKPGKPTPIVSTSPETLGWLVKKDPSPPEFELALDEFITEYTQSPRLEYPKDGRSRLAVLLGRKDLSYSMDEESLIQKDWFSKLRVLKGAKTAYEKTIEVNTPLKFEGYTFYQAAYEQRLKLKVKGRPEIIEANSGEGIEILPIGKVEFGALRNGTLRRLDGTVEKITPFVTVRKAVRTSDGYEKMETAGRLELGGSVKIDGKELALEGFEESSVLSYRYDPGVAVLWIAGSLVFIVMSLRCFGRWSMLAYSMEEREGKMNLLISIKARGLSSNPQRVVRAIARLLRTPS